MFYHQKLRLTIEAKPGSKIRLSAERNLFTCTDESLYYAVCLIYLNPQLTIVKIETLVCFNSFKFTLCVDLVN